MSSRSKSSNASKTDNITNDERIAADGNAIVTRSDGGSIIVNQTSDEALALGMEFAELAAEVTDGAFNLGEQVSGDAFDTAREALFDAFTQSNTVAAQAQSNTSNAIETLQHTIGTVLNERQEDSARLAEMLIKFGLPLLAGAYVIRGGFK